MKKLKIIYVGLMSGLVSFAFASTPVTTPAPVTTTTPTTTTVATTTVTTPAATPIAAPAPLGQCGSSVCAIGQFCLSKVILTCVQGNCSSATNWSCSTGYSCPKGGTGCWYTVSTVAGNGQATAVQNNVAATMTSLNVPQGVAFDPSHNMYIMEPNNGSIRQVNNSGIIVPWISGVNIAAITFDAAGNMFGVGNGAHVVRMAKAGSTDMPTIFQDPDGAVSYGIAVDAKGVVYYTDSANHTVKKLVNTNGQWAMTVIGGTKGTAGYDAAGKAYNQTHGHCG